MKTSPSILKTSSALTLFAVNLFIFTLFLSPLELSAHAEHRKANTPTTQNSETSDNEASEPNNTSPSEATDEQTDASFHAEETDKITEETSNEEEEYADDVEEEKSITYRSIKYAGKFHPILIHFPIAFLLGAVFMQWVFLLTRKKQIPPIVTTMLWMGTLGAIVASAAGWAYAYDSMYFGEEDIKTLQLHRWLGTSTAIAAVITLLLKRFLKPILFTLLLTVLAALVGAAAHQGGNLTYGADNFSEF